MILIVNKLVCYFYGFNFFISFKLSKLIQHLDIPYILTYCYYSWLVRSTFDVSKFKNFKLNSFFLYYISVSYIILLLKNKKLSYYLSIVKLKKNLNSRIYNPSLTLIV